MLTYYINKIISRDIFQILRFLQDGNTELAKNYILSTAVLRKFVQWDAYKWKSLRLASLHWKNGPMKNSSQTTSRNNVTSSLEVKSMMHSWFNMKCLNKPHVVWSSCLAPWNLPLNHIDLSGRSIVSETLPFSHYSSPCGTRAV